MRYLITGASGLLGSEICNLTKNAIRYTSSDCDLSISNHSILSIKDNSFDAVIHCAARVGGVKANIERVAEFFDDNMFINMNVLKACKERKVKLVSILSTCIYPDSAYVTYPLTEDQIHLGPPPISNFGYAYSKRMLDIQSKAYRQQYGCNFISVIPNNLYGPNDNYDLNSGHVIPALIRKFYEAKLERKDEVIVWGTGKPIREFTFARDAAEIILWLSENYDGDEPVNIGNPDRVSIENLAQMIGKEIGYDGRVRFDASKPDGQYEKPSSNAKLRSLGWKGDYTPIREGLRETIDHFKVKYPHIRGCNEKI